MLLESQLYLVRGLILFSGGLITALVTYEIKKRIISTLIVKEEKQKILNL